MIHDLRTQKGRNEYVKAMAKKVPITMKEFLSRMDFKLLKEQKSTLYAMQVKMEKGQKLSQKDWDVLEGMINLVNAIQDAAVDDYGYSERKVFRISKKDK